MFFILVCICCTTIFFSCSENIVTDPEDTDLPPTVLDSIPHYFVINGRTHISTNYDHSGRMSALAYYLNEGGFNSYHPYDTVSLTYDSMDRVISSTVKKDGWGNEIIADYYYSNDRLDSIISTQFGEGEEAFYLYYEENFGLPTSTEYYSYEENWEELLRSEVTNITRLDDRVVRDVTIIHNTNDTISYSTETIFDDKENFWPIRSVKPNSKSTCYVYKNQHNVIEYIVTEKKGKSYLNSFTSEFEFLPNGRPEREIRTYDEEIVNIDFYYKN